VLATEQRKPLQLGIGEDKIQSPLSRKRPRVRTTTVAEEATTAAENGTAMVAEDEAVTAAKDWPRRRPLMAPRRWMKRAVTTVVDGATTVAEKRAATAVEEVGRDSG
jgi:hypothetical protein